MAFGGKRPRQVLMFAAAGLLCVGSGVAVGRLPAWSQLVKAAPATAAPSQTTNQHKAAPAQSIIVHGWWTINVLDRRGRVVTSRQFENSLVTGSGNGDAILAVLLTRQSAMGPWSVSAGVAGGSAIFFDSAQVGSNNLTVNTGTLGHVILSGNYMPVAGNISITDVRTAVYVCSNATAPVNCTRISGTYPYPFTATTLAPPVPVANGQIVQFKVDISFS